MLQHTLTGGTPESHSDLAQMREAVGAVAVVPTHSLEGQNLGETSQI